MRMIFFIACFVSASLLASVVHSQDTPWGTAAAPVAGYAPQKVVYDIIAASEQEFSNVLDRMYALNVEYGSDPYDAVIIAVLRGPEIRFFDVRNFPQHEDLVRRAQALTSGGVIEFRICMHTAKSMGLDAEHFHGFIDMVPLGDAEIIQLQVEQGYAYSR